MALPLDGNLNAMPLEQIGATLTVSPSTPLAVEVGDTVVVEGVVDVENPLIGSLSLVINVAPGVPQDADQPIFEPVQPERVSIIPSKGGSFVLTAVRPGTVTFSMFVSGDAGVVLEDGTALTSTFGANGRTAEVTVVAGPAEPVQIPEPLTITLFSAGVVGIVGYTRRKRRHSE